MTQPAEEQRTQQPEQEEAGNRGEATSRSLVPVPDPPPGYEDLKPENAHAAELTEGITLNVWPRTRVTREQFIANFPAYSIGLDGFVPGPPLFEPEGPFRIFNHHEGVDGDCTRATCAQLHVAMKRGIFDCFQKNGVPYAHAFVEDPDQDVCYSSWLLQNHERVVGERSEPLLNRLLYIEDLLDCSAGMYPYDPNSKLMRQVAWMFEPYMLARLNGRLPEMDGGEMMNVIFSVGENITKYSLGEGGTRELDTRYEVLGGGEGWSMTKELGFNARAAYLRDNIKAFVAVMENPDGSHSYSIGRASPYVPFPLGPEMYEALNVHETTPCWGGGITIGGSRGGNGSDQTPDQVQEHLNTYLARSCQTPAGDTIVLRGSE